MPTNGPVESDNSSFYQYAISVSISVSSSVSSLNSPWLQTPPNQHYHHDHAGSLFNIKLVVIAPHNLTLTFPSHSPPPSLLSPEMAMQAENQFRMLDLGLVDFELNMDMNGGGADCSEYGYSDMSMGFDVGMGYVAGTLLPVVMI